MHSLTDDLDRRLLRGETILLWYKSSLINELAKCAMLSLAEELRRWSVVFNDGCLVGQESVVKLS